MASQYLEQTTHSPAVSGAGDVNNDTFRDVIIGAPYARNGNVGTGAAFVVFGKQSGFDDIPVLSMSSADGFTVFGSVEGDMLGVSVSIAGDVNGDGVDDIVIGALKATSSYRGGAYCIFGSSQTASIDTNTFDLDQGFAMVGPIWSWSGYSVSGAGDVNKDGCEDLLVGSVPYKTTFSTQITYLVFGNQTTAGISSLTAIVAQHGAAITGGGVVVSAVGDVNHDGFDDIMIGSNKFSFNGGGFVLFTNVCADAISSPSLQPLAVASSPPIFAPSSRPVSYLTQSPSGPSQTPTQSPTGPTSMPSSVPSTEPVTTRPTQARTSLPTLSPSSRTSEEPTWQPTRIPSRSNFSPVFRSRQPFLQSTNKPVFGDDVVVITEGGQYQSREKRTNYVINTNEAVFITGSGSVSGHIYTILPHTNGFLQIEEFNNLSDKLNLTLHSTIHSVSDLVITSGSVVITFPTTGQKIRIVNLTPTDTSEQNFVFHKSRSVDYLQSETRTIIITLLSNVLGFALLVFIVWFIYKRWKIYNDWKAEWDKGLISFENNQTVVQIRSESDSNIEQEQQIIEEINNYLFWSNFESKINDELISSNSKSGNSNSNRSINSSHHNINSITMRNSSSADAAAFILQRSEPHQHTQLHISSDTSLSSLSNTNMSRISSSNHTSHSMESAVIRAWDTNTHYNSTRDHNFNISSTHYNSTSDHNFNISSEYSITISSESFNGDMSQSDSGDELEILNLFSGSGSSGSSGSTIASFSSNKI